MKRFNILVTAGIIGIIFLILIPLPTPILDFLFILNISLSLLILGQFVIRGNAVIGFIIFLIIVLVQFIVITKGSERVAEVALERKTGARGLRGVLENVMTDIMFRIPSDETVCRVEITPGVVDGTGEPVVEHGERTAVPAEKKPPKKASRRKPTKSA